MVNRPRILGIIPARAGSKGILDKNIRPLAGKPLIQYTIQSALLSDYLDTILVSSDSEEILLFCSNFSELETPFIRPPELALDNTPTIKVVQHALEHYAATGKIFDYVCLLQPTSPFRNDKLIDKTIQKLIKEDADSLMTVRKVPAQYNPHWTFEMDENLLLHSKGNEHIIPRRQELPDCWYRDGKIYLASVDLIKKGMLFGGRTIGFANDVETNVNIDTWEDWNFAEELLENGLIY